MATKREIWEAKELIAYRIKEIELAQIGLAQSESDWQPKVVLLKCFSDMKDNLSTLKTHIIDDDDYTLAIELKDLIKPFLVRFNAELIKGEDDISRAINQQIFDFDSAFCDLQYWIREYETKHHETQQVEQTQHHETNEVRQTNGKVYKYKDKAMDAAFGFFVKSDVLNAENVTKADFLKAVESADFKKVREAAKTKKTYLDSSLSILKFFVDEREEWYRATAASIGKKTKNLTQNKTQNIENFVDELNGMLGKFV